MSVSPFEFFRDGRDGVKARFAAKISEAAVGLSSEHKSQLEEYVGFASGELDRILNAGPEAINSDVVQTLCDPFRITIEDGFGPFDEDKFQAQADEWTKRAADDEFVPVAGATDGAWPEHETVKLFVMLCALQQL